DAEYIGRIQIEEDHSFVDLPEGMPKEIFKHLQSVWVSGQKLRISKPGPKPGSKPGAKPPKKTAEGSDKTAGGAHKTAGGAHKKGPRKRKVDA
ncbi:MAG: DbpA RNA binding domain-containing protein, partial [Congregibacter sp.]|nr:DbpA RNA binding domain-containing protein [Congregibacter sp.]